MTKIQESSTHIHQKIHELGSQSSEYEASSSNSVINEDLMDQVEHDIADIKLPSIKDKIISVAEQAQEELKEQPSISKELGTARM